MTEFQVPDGAGWFEKHVVEALSRLERGQDEIRSDIRSTDGEVQGLRERMAVVEVNTKNYVKLAVFIIGPVVTAIISTLVYKVFK